jgi:predicted RNA-binding Zn ribbon-like protein
VVTADRYAFQRSDLVGGHVVLDLVNTVTGRDSRPTDWLETYERVLEWAALTDTFDASSLHMLDGMRTADGRAAARALTRLRDLREAVYDVVVATISGEPAPEQALSRLEEHWKNAVVSARLTFSEGRAELQLDAVSSRLEHPRHLLSLSAFDLLQTLPLERTRECASPPCTWIFIDRSRGGQRRWCDMATCGNQAKSRRHYERTRAGERAEARRMRLLG